MGFSNLTCTSQVLSIAYEAAPEAMGILEVRSSLRNDVIYQFLNVRPGADVRRGQT